MSRTDQKVQCLARPIATPSIAIMVCGLVGVIAGCGVEEPGVDPYAYPTTGLYTPNSKVGASDPTDFPMAMALGDRCKAPFATGPDAGVVGTEGQLQLSYQTFTYEGRYTPRNCTAAWIETEAGDYVATIEQRCAIRTDEGLVFFVDRTCLEEQGPDVRSSATLRNHMTMHEAEWNGLDLNGNPVPDGNYNVLIEVTEEDDNSFLSTFPFVKGPEAFSVQPGINAGDPLLTVSLSWSVQ